MIRLPDVDLPAPALATLRDYQMGIDGLPSYAAQVEAAERLFKSRNSTRNATFRTVRSKLDELCSGVRRCCYCEDSFADEVEHIRPKSFYPQQVFEWENYVYACGPCNGPKNNRYALFVQADGSLLHLSRAKGAAVVPPPAGDHVLIDPRRENALDFLELDLLGTFYFLPRAPKGTRERQRAEYTIEVLRLNERDILPEARRDAFGSYKARLHEYRCKKASGVSAQELQLLKKGIQKMPHPTVWAEIKRQHLLHPELRELMAAVPKALAW